MKTSLYTSNVPELVVEDFKNMVKATKGLYFQLKSRGNREMRKRIRITGGGGDERTNEQTDKRTKVPLCSTGAAAQKGKEKL